MFDLCPLGGSIGLATAVHGGATAVAQLFHYEVLWLVKCRGHFRRAPDTAGRGRDRTERRGRSLIPPKRKIM